MNTSSPTEGVRTWCRTGADASRPLAERVVETTDADDMAASIAAADFVTIPRQGTSRQGTSRQGPEHVGYGDAYAAAFAAALSERFGYADARRVSGSGRSHVFEREALSQGAAVDLGVSVGSVSAPGSVDPAVGRAPAASQGPLAVDPGGDGAALRPPTLAAH